MWRSNHDRPTKLAMQDELGSRKQQLNIDIITDGLGTKTGSGLFAVVFSCRLAPQYLRVLQGTRISDRRANYEAETPHDRIR
jgi:hypothetical protein